MPNPHEGAESWEKDVDTMWKFGIKVGLEVMTRKDMLANRELTKDIIRSVITHTREQTKQACIEAAPEKDETPDASEYERADRIAWNACRDAFIKRINELTLEHPSGIKSDNK